MKERVNRLGMWASEETLAVTQLLSSWKVENRFMKFDFFSNQQKVKLTGRLWSWGGVARLS